VWIRQIFISLCVDIKLFLDDINVFVYGKSIDAVVANANTALRFLCSRFYGTEFTLNLNKTLLAQYAAGSMQRYGVRLSACPSVCLAHLAAGLLLWAPRTGDIDRVMHGASAAGAAIFRSLSTAAEANSAKTRPKLSTLWRRRCCYSDLTLSIEK